MKKLLIFLLFLIPLFLPKITHADINGPSSLNSSGIEVGSKTQVQMKNEKVTLQISGNSYKKTFKIFDLRGGPDYFNWETSNFLPVKVTAEFNMYNTSDTTESIDVTFPKCDYYSGRTESCGSMSDFSVFVNGTQVLKTDEVSEIISSKTLGYTPQSTVSGVFYKWHQSFPPKTITNVKVIYTLAAQEFAVAHPPYTGPAGYYINYILSTGGSWKGNIENGQVIFDLPYQVNDKYYTIFSGTPRENETLSSKLSKSTKDNQVIIDFKNLKPSYNENLNLVLFDPTEISVLNTLVNNAEKGNTFSAYAAVVTEYVKFIKSHYLYTLSRLPSGIKNIDDQLFQNFYKLIKLANNYSQLKEATNIFFFDSKNLSDEETIPTKIQDACWAYINPNGNYRDDYDHSETCNYASDVQELTGTDLLNSNSVYKSAIKELARKRLVYNSSDALAIYLLSSTTRPTPTLTPVPIDYNKIDTKTVPSSTIFDYFGLYDVVLFAPLFLIPLILFIKYMLSSNKKKDVMEKVKKDLPGRTVVVGICVWLVVVFINRLYLYNVLNASKSEMGQNIVIAFGLVGVAFLIFAYYKYAKQKRHSKLFSLLGLLGIMPMLGLFGLPILFFLPQKAKAVDDSK